MGTKFPLCESVGLSPLPVVDQSTWNISSEIFINAKAVEALLAKGVRVFGGRFGTNGQWSFVSHIPGKDDTHEALVLNIKPIKRERKRELSESEVREALTAANYDKWKEMCANKDEIISRLFGEEG